MSKPESHDLQAMSPASDEGAKTGRPSTYSDAVGWLICERIAAGETLTAICLTPGLPARQTVHKWRRANSGFDDDYRRARVDQMEAWSDELLTIADDSSLDTTTRVDRHGREYEAPDHENVQRSKLMVHTRQWLMAKLAPMYADKVAHEHSGEVVQRVEFSDRERMRRLVSYMLQDQLASGEAMPIGAVIDMQPEPASLSPAEIIAGNTKPDDQ